MATLYVALSKTLQTWSADVGLTRHVYLVGVTTDPAEAAVAALNQRRHAGRSDWTLVAHEEAGEVQETDALARLARKEKRIDPRYYPQVKGADGLFKVNLINVENQVLLQQALAGRPPKPPKMTSAIIAAYLLRVAKG